jgi:hypothetical protein
MKAIAHIFALVALVVLLVANIDVLGEIASIAPGSVALVIVLVLIVAVIVLASFLLGAMRHHRWVKERMQHYDDANDVESSSRDITRRD